MAHVVNKGTGELSTAADGDAVSDSTSVVGLSSSNKRSVSDLYFDTMSRIQASASARNYENAAQFVRENLEYIPNWVGEECRDLGSFVASSIPALEQGGTILALVGDEDGLARMNELVTSIPELENWADRVERHLEDLQLFRCIQETVKINPNCLQLELKGLVGEPDGRRVALLVSYLEKHQKIVRVKTGSTYRLLTHDSHEADPLSRKRKIGSHRVDQSPPSLQQLDAESLSYVYLPRAPKSKTAIEAGKEHFVLADVEGHFEIRDADWKVERVEKLRLSERPDGAFRKFYPSRDGLLMIDDLGKAGGLGPIDAAALCYDRDGRTLAKEALLYDAYRIGVNALGGGLVAMSRDCVLHAYDRLLKPILETTLTDNPEMHTLRKRFEILDGHLKNHIRCIALSSDTNRYIYTAVDEAWCVDIDGNCLWGARLPFQDGWKRLGKASEIFGTDEDVEDALALMELSLPVTPKELKQRYHMLAMKWHPDLNHGDADAGDKMKSLSAAAELLTGLDAEAIEDEFESDSTVYFGPKVGDSNSGFLQLKQEIIVADWIYAASFAASSNAVYLAGYSGRIIVVDENGKGVRAYDIGSVPRRITDTGDYLYLLTDTRLYVLREDSLFALIDTFDDGELIFWRSGFGLLEKKRLRCFSEDGNYLGSVVSKDPIRRVYASEDDMVLETRQRRAIVSGLPA